MNLTKRLTINTLSQLIARVGIVLLAITTTTILRRYFGQSGYGDYIYLLNIVTIFVALADLGTHLVSVRESASGVNEKAGVLGLALQLRTLLALAAAALVAAILLFTGGSAEVRSQWLLCGILVLVLLAKESVGVIFHSIEKLYWTSVVQFVSALVMFAVALVVALAKLDLSVLLLGMIIGLSSFAIPMLAYFIKSGQVRLSYNKLKMVQLLTNSVPIGGTLVLFTIYSRIDTVLINHFYGSAAVGAYGLAYKVYDNLTLPAAFFLNALLPELSRISNQLPSALPSLLRNSLAILLASAAAVTAITLILAPVGMSLLTGEAAGAEADVMRMLAFALVFSYANHLTGYALIAMNRQRLSFYAAGIALLFNVVANWVMLPMYGVIAAAVVTIATEALVLGLTGTMLIMSLLKEAK